MNSGNADRPQTPGFPFLEVEDENLRPEPPQLTELSDINTHVP